jgi:hypothetical protein
MSVEGFEAAAARIRARLADVEPFRVSLEPFEYFRHKNALTLWLRPVDEVQLKQQPAHALDE